MAGNLFKLAASTEWAILPESLQLILEIAAREHTPDFEAVAAKKAARMDGTDKAYIRNGVSIIPVIGPIVRRGDFFSDVSGATSVDRLAKDFNAALNDPIASSILLEIDSPGGEVTGVNEFAKMIFDARGQKPIVAYVGGTGASAAYWIASAADEVIADASARLGSIGVVATVPNPDAKKASDVQFVSSQSPRKRPNPNTESGKADIQGQIDALADVFVDAVARNRGVSADKVLDSFGQGGVFVGRHAVEAGLADSLGSFESTLTSLAMGKKPKRYASASAIATEEIPMSQEKTILEGIKGLLGMKTEATAEQPLIAGGFIAPDSIAIKANNEAIERMKAEHLETQKQLAAEKTARINAEAVAYYNEQFAAGKILPAEKDSFIQDFKLAVADDDANPVEGAKRLDRLKQRTEARPAHAMFTERVKADGDITLPAATDPKAVTAEREKELLGLTSLGQATLRTAS